MKGEVVAIDGKLMCGSADSDKPRSAVQKVSASDNRRCLGQKTVDTKSNKITNISKLQEILSIKGCVVTIETMGCQTNIAESII